MDDDDAAMSCYLAEWYTPGWHDRPIADMARVLRLSLAGMTAEPHRPRLLYAVKVSQDHYAFGVFAADSADIVSRACVQAGLPADRVTAAARAPMPSAGID